MFWAGFHKSVNKDWTFKSVWEDGCDFFFVQWFDFSSRQSEMDSSKFHDVQHRAGAAILHHNLT